MQISFCQYLSFMVIRYWRFECWSNQRYFFEQELQETEQIVYRAGKFWKENAASYLGSGKFTNIYFELINTLSRYVLNRMNSGHNIKVSPDLTSYVAVNELKRNILQQLKMNLRVS